MARKITQCNARFGQGSSKCPLHPAKSAFLKSSAFDSVHLSFADPAQTWSNALRSVSPHRSPATLCHAVRSSAGHTGLHRWRCQGGYSPRHSPRRVRHRLPSAAHWAGVSKSICIVTSQRGSGSLLWTRAAKSGAKNANCSAGVRVSRADESRPGASGGGGSGAALTAAAQTCLRQRVRCDDDAATARGSAGGGVDAGSCRINVEPCPRVLSTVMRPPISSVSF